MKMKIVFVVLFLLAAFFLSLATNLIRISMFISKAEVKQTITATADSLQRYYIFPGKGQEMANALRKGLADGAFNMNNPKDLADSINNLLQRISKDKHLHFGFSPRLCNDLRQPGRTRFNNYFLTMARLNNYYIEPIRIMAGHIGYLRLDQLIYPPRMAEKIDSTLDSLRQAKAIVLDLRYNGGGEPEMVQNIITHFYAPDTLVHLNDFYSRRTDSVTQYWTLPKMKGVHLPKMPLFVLISKNTASAAEEIAYDLKNLHRATLIGENTAGGAHAGDLSPIGERFFMFLPDQNTINPYSKTNWEQSGIVPDVPVAAEKALDKALELAR